MAISYPYTKETMDHGRLRKEIKANGTITTEFNGSEWAAPDSLSVIFDAELSTGEEAALDGVVAAHSGDPLTDYVIWCYTCNTHFQLQDTAVPTECPTCEGSAVEDITDRKYAIESKTYYIEITSDIVQHIVQAWTTQTNDLLQCQKNNGDPVLRIDPKGSLILPITNTTVDGEQILIANIQTPGGSDILVGIKVDYTGLDLSSGPDVYGLYVALPATYGDGTEAAGSFNGAGRTASFCSNWEALYASDGTRSGRIATWEASFYGDGGKLINDFTSTEAFLVRKSGDTGDIFAVDTENEGMKLKVHTDDVSNPPTDAELDTIFGTPATVGAGFTAYIDDNGAGSNFYQVTSDGTNWWILTGTKAT